MIYRDEDPAQRAAAHRLAALWGDPGFCEYAKTVGWDLHAMQGIAVIPVVDGTPFGKVAKALDYSISSEKRLGWAFIALEDENMPYGFRLMNLGCLA